MMCPRCFRLRESAFGPALVLLAVISIGLMACSGGGNSAPAGLQVSGRVVDAAGVPVTDARVALARGGATESVSVSEVGEDGSYVVTVPPGGFYELRFQAVDKDRLTIPFWIEPTQGTSTNLDVCANGYNFKLDPRHVLVLGSFNDFSTLTAEPMEKQEDGTWVLEVESGESSVDYQIVGVNDSPGMWYHGNQDGVRYRSDHGWVGVAPVVKGRSRIVVAAGEPPSSRCERQFSFSDPALPEAVFAQTTHEMWDLYADANAEFNALDNKKEKGKAFWTSFTGDQLDPLVLDRLARVKYREHREYIAAFYWELLRVPPDPEAPGVAAQNTFDLLSPTSEALASRRYGVLRLYNMGRDIWPERTETFFDQIVEHNRDVELVSHVLQLQITYAKLDGEDEVASALMARLFAEYPESVAAEMVRQRWGDLSPIPIGSPAPDFSVASLADATKSITRADLEGAPYLIDFWATWCGPCIKEMPYLHKAYEKYADRGFKILSVSMDEDRSKAEAFVGTKFEMPWLNAIDTEGTEGKMATDYGVLGIPAPVLVDSNGVIVAKSYELFGDNLGRQLDELFAGKTGNN